MEVYLNVIEMGDGVYGAEAASEYYFHKHARDITSPEAALIAGCLPQPFKLNPGNPSGLYAGPPGVYFNPNGPLGG